VSTSGGIAFDEARLDNAATLFEADTTQMLRAVATCGAQVRESRQLAEEAGVADLSGGVPPRAAVVLVDGPVGAVLGDLLRALAGPEAVAPISVITGGPLPPWLGPSDLAFVVSYKGIDGATLRAVELASRRGVPLLGAGPGGTPLHEAVVARLRSPYVALPLREPRRASFWSLATPVLIGAARSGLIRLPDSELVEAADQLDVVAERCRPDSETFVNPGKALAVQLADGLPVIWGSTAVAGVAARRLAGQLAGNAARIANWGTLPASAREFGGIIEVPGGAADDFFRDRLDEPDLVRPRLVLLRDEIAETDEVRRFVALAGRQAADRGLRVTELQAEGEPPLQRFASLAALADFATVYCGLASGVDPGGVRPGEW
jgi:glucose/mannose-6-phosphate isomerase